MQQKLLYGAAAHYRRGRELEAEGSRQAALEAWQAALRDLHAVAPQRMRDILLAQVYLACHIASRADDPERAAVDLRLGYSYARTTRDASVRKLAEELWNERREALAAGPLE